MAEINLASKELNVIVDNFVIDQVYNTNPLLASISRIIRHAGEHSGSIVLTPKLQGAEQMLPAAIFMKQHCLFLWESMEMKWHILLQNLLYNLVPVSSNKIPYFEP